MLHYICWCCEVAHGGLVYVGCPGIVFSVWILSRKLSIWSSPYVWHQCVALTSRAGHYDFCLETECFSLTLFLMLLKVKHVHF